MIGNLRARIFQSLEPCAGLDRAGNRRHKTAMKTSFAILPLLLLGLTANAASVFTTEQTTNEIRVLADGKLFCAYVFSGAPKPYVYPLTAPDGVTLQSFAPGQNCMELVLRSDAQKVKPGQKGRVTVRAWVEKSPAPNKQLIPLESVPPILIEISPP